MLTRRDFLAQSAGTALLAACSSKGLPMPGLHTTTQRAVQSVLQGIPTTDGAGVRLTRVIGQPRLRNLDPFLMLDRFHSDDPGAYIAGFPDHPHRGFETVTVMLAGRMLHKDSKGNQGLIEGGGAQWMTAGRGIIHSEMPQQEDGLMSGFQLWVNLPAREKMRAQEYQDIPKAQIAAHALSSGGEVRIISGPLLGKAGPVAPRTTEPLLLTATLEDDQPLRIDVPEAHTGFVFVHEGELTIGERTVPAGNIALLTPGNTLTLRALSMRTGVLVAAAKPIGEPIVQYGPFVMNTEAEIHQAISDYRAGTLAL